MGHFLMALCIIGSGLLPTCESLPRRLREGVSGKVLSGHDEGVNTAAFFPDGRYLATAGKDGLIILWDAKTWQKSLVLNGTELAGSR